MTFSTSITLLLQLFASTFVTFFLAACCVEATLKLLRIRNFRARALFRLIPVIKLPLMLVLFNVAGDGVFRHFNFFSCDNALHQLLFHLTPEYARSHSTEDIMAFAYTLKAITPSMKLKVLIACIPIISLVNVLWKIAQMFAHSRRLQRLKNPSHKALCSFANRRLSAELAARNANVYFSDQVDVPFATKDNNIFLPQSLTSLLSQEELEAVIAHELEHVKWSDPTVKCTGALIGAFFWWVPVQWWLNKIEREQEYASDSSLKGYGITGDILANGIAKIVRLLAANKERMIAVSYLAKEEGALLTRVKFLLRDDCDRMHIGFRKKAALALAGALATLLGFWIC